ncbi:MAG: hypothetical protein GY749_02810 [Desulfobacteraceae bacterium]|nr:hypothetical protein [Desulfobacteraceae bacterium]
MQIDDKPHCTIDYDPKLKCVIQTWRGFAGSQKFRASILETIDAFARHDAEAIISNTQEAEAVKQNDADWVATYANPILIRHGLCRIAFIVPESVLGKWSVNHFMQESTEQLKMQYFDNFDKAKAWIAQSL